MGTHPYQTNFTAGELSPYLFSRVDYKKYPNGAESLINAVVKVTGGASRRAGTQFIAKARTRGAFQPNAFQKSAFQTGANTKVRLVPFVFNTQTAFVLEFGPQYIRFYRNREQLLGNGSGNELVTNGMFAADLSSWTVQQDSGATVTWQSPGVAQLEPNAAGAAGISQVITGLSLGEKYVLNFTIGNAQVILNVGDVLGAGNLVSEQTLTPGVYRVVFTAPSNGTAVLYWRTSVPAAVARLDDVSLKLALPLEMTTPYLSEDLRSLRFSQSADTMYITHSKYHVKKLLRLSDNLWTLQDVFFTPPATEEVAMQPSAKLTPAASSGSGIVFTADASVFLAADVNRQIKSQGGVAIISAVTSGTQVTADIVAPFLSTNPIPSGLWSLDGSPSSDITFSAGKVINAIVTATLTLAGFRSTDVGKFILALDGIFEIKEITSSTVAKAKVLKVVPGASLTAVSGAWKLETESWSDALGHPQVSNFYEQRLWFFKNQKYWGSVSGDFENFANGVKDDDAVEGIIASGSNQVDVIRWVKSLKDQLIGTIGTEYRMYGGTESAITPTRILNKPQSEWGSDPEPDAVRAGTAILFVQRGRRQINELGFSIERDGFDRADLTIVAEHLFRTGVVEIARVASPDSYILAVLEDGRMAVATYYREEDVVAWSQFQPAGWPKKGKFRSVCVIPSKCGSGDEIWVAVERTINGRRGLYVEVFDGQLNTECALVYEGTVLTDTLVGLTHLEGETADVLYTAQSSFQKSAFQMTAFQKVRIRYATAKISGGAATIAKPSVRIEVGLHYDTTIKTLPLETQTRDGTAHFRKKRSVTVYTRFYCSKGDGIRVNGEKVPYLAVENEDIYDFRREVNLGWDRKEPVTITQTQPFSMTVLGVSRNLIVDDGENP